MAQDMHAQGAIANAAEELNAQPASLHRAVQQLPHLLDGSSQSNPSHAPAPISPASDPQPEPAPSPVTRNSDFKDF